MRNFSRAIARSARPAAIGALVLAAALSGNVAHAQTSAPVAAPQTSAAAMQPSSQVTLYIDSPAAGVSSANGQRLFVGGWAGAPGGTDSGIQSVDVFLDGAPDAGGTLLGTATLGIARPDVATVTRNTNWGKSGFNFDWTPRLIPEGSHTLYIVAHSTSGATATQQVAISACGCGSNFQGSVTNPGVRRIGTIGWELDTGGPGVLIQRELSPWPW
jgi:hypothetical protein